MITAQDIEIQDLVAAVRDSKLLLPELQRGYVWKSTQVRDLFDSLYRQYPSGQLLIWETDDVPFSRTANVDQLDKNSRRPQLLLDGQQRITSLAAIMLGRALIVGDSKRPIDIAFNVYTEKFEVVGLRQRIEAGWVSLSKLFTEGELSILQGLNINLAGNEAGEIFERLKRISNIKTYKYRVNVFADLSYEVVTDIFVRINSGGTKLNSADLALAQLSSRWRGVTEYFNDYQKQLAAKRLSVDFGLFLRMISVFLTGQSRLPQLFRGERQHLTVEALETAWKRTRQGMDQAVAFLIQNCKIDRLDLLPTNFVLIPLTVFFDQNGDQASSEQIRELQRWVYMALIWSRYSGTHETFIDQDVSALQKNQAIGQMIQNIEDRVGKRPVTERELREQRKNSPYMLMSYVLARYAQAQDWFNGVELGGAQTLELHHIFPKALLREKYDLRADSRTVDQVANLALLSQRANGRISSSAPEAYLTNIPSERLRAQLIPQDESLWKLEKFEAFLLERRKMMAEAINQLLANLAGEPSFWTVNSAEMQEMRVDTLEHVMRELVIDRLTEAFGSNAWNHAIPTQMRKNLEHRVDHLVAAHPYKNNEYVSLEGKLSLCQFSDYPKIVEANWTLFEDLFGKVEQFSSNFQLITNARNAIKHNRELSRSELAAAEAGLVWLEECLRNYELENEETEEESAELA